ncbi:hypothetical protein L204_102629 [Cryptococcus depauperatus]
MASLELNQLLDMGISHGRARAALKRTRGDVMSAAERVFAGEFDDILSDDEDEDQAESNEAYYQEYNQVMKIDDQDEAIDEDSAEEDGDDFDEDMGYDDSIYNESMSDGEPVASDPYAGIFFSKDRVEEIIEPIEKENLVDIYLPNGKSLQVGILERGEWMSGCPEGGEQSFLFQLYDMLEDCQMPCSSGCGFLFTRHKRDFFSLFPTFPEYTSYLSHTIRLTCPQCGQVTCLACGERADRLTALEKMNEMGKGKKRGSSAFAYSSDVLSTTDGPSTTSTPPTSISPPPRELLHCPALQGVILGVGLHMIDRTFSQGQNQTRQAEDRMHPSNKKRKVTEKEEGLSSVSCGLLLLGKVKNARGTGYAGSTDEDRSGQIKAEEMQRLADSAVSVLLQHVQQYLPNINRQGGPATSDYLVHPTALAHLRRRSNFINALLRNDSLLDMSNRDAIYRALFDWLEIVSNNESLASMLGMPQMRPVRTRPLEGSEDSLVVTYEGAPSPRELLEFVAIQAQAALRGLRHVGSTASEETKVDQEMTEEELQTSKEDIQKKAMTKPEGPRDENATLEAFCLRILKSASTIDLRLAETKGKAFVQRMKEQLPRLEEGIAQAERGEKANEKSVIQMYEEWATRARFQYVDLKAETGSSKTFAWRHAFSAQITQLENTSLPKRSLAIAKELAILTTNLPVAWHSSIFLRVDEVRVDVLKAMIIGPEGTPYENGCFLFDIFLPLDYNYKSPIVQYMTTNGGRYRYNPNLYPDGKVCLSLLGTWSGPGWISEEPFLNEPSWADMGGSPQSKAYDANIRRMVLLDAMANNMKTPPYPFENEIQTHFRLKASAIRTQIEKWKTLDDGKMIHGDGWTDANAGPNTNPDIRKSFDGAAAEVKRMLCELEGKQPPAPVDMEASNEKKKKIWRR